MACDSTLHLWIPVKSECASGLPDYDLRACILFDCGMTNIGHRRTTQEREGGCCQNYVDSVVYGIGRKKPLSSDMEGLFKTSLKRCLGLGDLVAYGLASMLGGSIYVLTGAVMLKHTGPAVFIAYLIAGIVAMFNALIYSELTTRIPKSGSSYSYAYILLGELLGFLTGWSILLEYILGTCTVTRGWSSMLDGLTDGRISSWIIQNIGRLSNQGDILAEYPDFVGAIFIVVMASISCCGVQGGARVTGIFIFINVCALVIVSIYMFVFSKLENLTAVIPSNFSGLDPYSPNQNLFPFGLGGLIGGVAICFNAYIGFDAISTCAEESNSPGRDLPRANVLAVLIVTAITMTSSLALALYYPWYLASPEIPFLSVLKDNFNGGSAGARTGMRYFVGCACLIGLTSSLVSNLVAGPRIMYAIAQDGLLPTFCANVCKPFQTPVIATLFFTIITIVLEMIFSIVSLADFLSLGTLIAYSMASIGLLMLRYGTPPEETINSREMSLSLGSTAETDTSTEYILRVGKPGYLKKSWSKCLGVACVRTLNKGSPGTYVGLLISIYVLLNSVLIIILKIGASESLWPIWRLVTFPVVLILMIVCIVFMSAYEQHRPPARELFRLPLVPFFPCATLSVNMFLIAELSWITWVRFLIWLAVGLLIYFIYGVCHSVAGQQELEAERAGRIPAITSPVDKKQ